MPRSDWGWTSFIALNSSFGKQFIDDRDLVANFEEVPKV